MAESEAQGSAHPWEKSYPGECRLERAAAHRRASAAARRCGRPFRRTGPPSTSWTRSRAIGSSASRRTKAAEGFQKLGVGKGKKVGIFLPNCTNFVAVYYGVLKAGGTVVNVQPALRHRGDQEPDRGFGDRHPGHPRPLHPLRQGPHRARPDAPHPPGDRAPWRRCCRASRSCSSPSSSAARSPRSRAIPAIVRSSASADSTTPAGPRRSRSRPTKTSRCFSTPAAPPARRRAPC